MGDLSGGWFALVVGVQLFILVSLVLLGFRLVKVIKSQNNNMLLAPDLKVKLKKMFGRSPKS